MSENLQTLYDKFISLSCFSGIGLGVGLKNSSDEPWTARDAMYVKFIGELFLNMLKCVIIPLVVPSLIHAIGEP